MTKTQIRIYRLAILAIAVIAGLTIGCEYQCVTETSTKKNIQGEVLSEIINTTCGFRNANSK